MRQRMRVIVYIGPLSLFLAFVVSFFSLLQIKAATDLGEASNTLISVEYENYRSQHPLGSCASNGQNARVLISGFGLFDGVDYNGSGTVIKSMMDTQFWPQDSQFLSQFPQTSATPGKLTSKDNGAFAVMRTLKIEEKSYDVCFVLLEVRWDLAAAILNYEIQKMKPNLILMTGRSGAKVEIEGEATNITTTLLDFNFDGEPLNTPPHKNIPNSKWIVDNYPTSKTIKLNWDIEKVAQAITPLVKQLGFDTVSNTFAQPGNDYICNNVSFYTAISVLQPDIYAAGDKIKLSHLTGSPTPQFGFLHIPAFDIQQPNLEAATPLVFGFAQVFAKIISTLLK